MAFLIWSSEEFSTTITWNWRGRNIIAIIERNVREVHSMKLTFDSSPISMFAACSVTLNFSKISSNPLKSPYVTKIPTDIKAISFMADSKAIANTRPL